MQFTTKCAQGLVVAILVCGPSAAQRKPMAADSSPAVGKAKLLTREEGLALVDTAFEKRFRTTPDCSHFVHSVYNRAGYPFQYAPADDLYSGIPEFRYVKHPQPGDLVVWHGHAGIVVDPPRHVFFSVLSTGLKTDSYNSKYWKQRGRARFFRYRKNLRQTLENN